jgi:hypothetical protein
MIGFANKKGLGLPKDPKVNISLDLLDRSNCLFLFEALSESLQNIRNDGPSEDGTQSRPGFTNMSGDPETPKPSPFKWYPSDLSPEGAWHQKRLINLRKAANACTDSEQVFQDGLIALEIHRNNYNADGPSPKQLQLMWWEFPSEHWTPLQEGSRMNFMEPVIKPNANMDEEQHAVRAAFVDELLELKVLGLLENEDMIILLNAPLFVVPKDATGWPKHVYWE